MTAIGSFGEMNGSSAHLAKRSFVSPQSDSEGHIRLEGIAT